MQKHLNSLSLTVTESELSDIYLSSIEIQPDPLPCCKYIKDVKDYCNTGWLKTSKSCHFNAHYCIYKDVSNNAFKPKVNKT